MNTQTYNIHGMPCCKLEYDFYTDQRRKGMSRALALRLVLQSRRDVILLQSRKDVNPLINQF